MPGTTDDFTDSTDSTDSAESTDSKVNTIILTPSPTAPVISPDELYKFPRKELEYPLERCRGDCDNDDECKDDLVCYQRNSDDPVPGCIDNGGVDGVDFCSEPIVPLPLQWCGEVPQVDLGPCQGDCDMDRDCLPGLKCRHRKDNTRKVPGCYGPGIPGAD